MINNNPNQPKEFDAVLGGKNPLPIDGVVLGGIEGIKHRLKSVNPRERATVLIDVLRYGNEGLDLLVESLIDPSEQVRLFAGILLRDKGGERGKQALLKHNPSLLLTTLDNWKFESFSPNIGINASVSTAYDVNCYDGQYIVLRDREYKEFTLEYLQAFLKDPQVCEVEALACWSASDPYNSERCEKLINLLCNARKRLTNLKALFIGDRREHEYKKADFYMKQLSPILDAILEAFPDLQVIKLRGQFDRKECSTTLRHNKLKTLIIETPNSILGQICNLELPALEYLEVWNAGSTHGAKSILTGQVFPNLCYLGLPSFENTDRLMEAIAQAPTRHLAILDLHLGELTDKGAKFLINSPIIKHLHTLNIAKNCLSEKMTQRFSKLNCHVIVTPQGTSGDRYCALHE